MSKTQDELFSCAEYANYKVHSKYTIISKARNLLVLQMTRIYIYICFFANSFSADANFTEGNLIHY